ncbi:MAG: helix-turn-helix domain-containing protein [Lachnospiraceae bacterium]|nr:helix-turn-helix domain-containing protein [Lachnospiraceae bacterium]
MKILNFGSCNIDFVYSVSHIVRPGETLTAGSLSQFPGGKGLNQAIAIAKAGAPVYFAGCIGEDDTMLRQVLLQAGVDLTYLKTVKERTGQAIIQVDENGENSIFIYHGANGAVSKEQIDRVLADFEAGDILLLQNEISNLKYLIERSSDRGMKIVLNPSPFEPMLKEIDPRDLFCVILNETEAMQWSDTQHPYDFLFWAQKNYPALHVVLTLGKKGSIYLKDGKMYRQQAFKATAVDTTAAGDTFTGYFLAGLYKNAEVLQGLKMASAASAIAVSKKGAASSIPTCQEVENAIDGMELSPIDTLEEQKEVVRTFIATHIKDVKLSDVAALINYTEDHTCRWVHKNFGMGFSEFLQAERCRIAAEYLKNTDMPIHEIIELVGYNNGSFFRKVFHKYYQMSPLEYRKGKV